MLEPKNPDKDVAVIIEFKVFNHRREKTLEDTLHAALERHSFARKRRKEDEKKQTIIRNGRNVRLRSHNVYG